MPWRYERITASESATAATEGDARQCGGDLAGDTANLSRRLHVRVERFELRGATLEVQHHDGAVTEEGATRGGPGFQEAGEGQSAKRGGADFQESAAVSV